MQYRIGMKLHRWKSWASIICSSAKYGGIKFTTVKKSKWHKCKIWFHKKAAWTISCHANFIFSQVLFWWNHILHLCQPLWENDVSMTAYGPSFFFSCLESFLIRQLHMKKLVQLEKKRFYQRLEPTSTILIDLICTTETLMLFMFREVKLLDKFITTKVGFRFDKKNQSSRLLIYK